MSFAPYQPPPDLPPDDSTRKPKVKRPWFASNASSFLGNGNASNGSPSSPGGGGGYQSGSSGSNGPTSYASSSQPAASYSSSNPIAEAGGVPFGGGTANSWETRFGWRVDILAAAAYVLGPFSAVLLLILETTNDFVRFHAYQSALLTTPLLLLHFIVALIFPAFLNFIFTLVSVGIIGYMAFHAYSDANAGLSRYFLPVIGLYADRWVGEE